MQYIANTCEKLNKKFYQLELLFYFWYDERYYSTNKCYKWEQYNCTHFFFFVIYIAINVHVCVFLFFLNVCNMITCPHSIPEQEKRSVHFSFKSKFSPSCVRLLRSLLKTIVTLGFFFFFILRRQLFLPGSKWCGKLSLYWAFSNEHSSFR